MAKRQYSPQKGNISDIRLRELFNMPVGTFTRWKNGDGHKKKIYELLKVIKEDEFKLFFERIQELKKS